MARKTPILLRPSPLTGEVMALHSYRWVEKNGHRMLNTGMDGKQSVTADFDAIVLTALMDGEGDGAPAPDIALILDALAQGYDAEEVTKDVANYQEQLRGFRERLVKIIERHNTTGHGAS